jgi:hypothetical protein
MINARPVTLVVLDLELRVATEIAIHWLNLWANRALFILED